eukprot:scaffold659930_cov46-Prasinocladus_malaysianus.AAC.1
MGADNSLVFFAPAQMMEESVRELQYRRDSQARAAGSWMDEELEDRLNKLEDRLHLQPDWAEGHKVSRLSHNKAMPQLIYATV